MPRIFRSYDIRGIYPKDLTPRIAELLGKAFGTYFEGNGTIVVGRDMRKSGEVLKERFTKGLMSTGCDVIDVGMVPTPVVYFGINRLKADGGVSVTASHNPPEWNGFKLRKENALGLYYDEGLKEVEKIFLSRNFAKGNGRYESVEITEDYVDEMCRRLRVKNDIKVVVDAGNGMGGIAMDVLENLGVETKGFFLEPDGRFPHHTPDPFKEDNLKFLQKAVLKEGSDVGIALDGDCDRVGFVDDKGRVVNTDYAILLYLNDMREEENKRVVIDVRCPNVVVEKLKEWGYEVYITRVGNPYLMEKLHEVNGIFAGEISGHFWFRRWFGFDDGIFAGAKMVEILSRSGRSLSSLVDGMPKRYFIPDRRVPCSDYKKGKVIEKLKGMMIKEYGKERVITTDGVKVFGDGWSVLVRASNTQPMITLTVDSDKGDVEDIYKKFKEMVEELIKRV